MHVALALFNFLKLSSCSLLLRMRVYHDMIPEIGLREKRRPEGLGSVASVHGYVDYNMLLRHCIEERGRPEVREIGMRLERIDDRCQLRA